MLDKHIGYLQLLDSETSYMGALLVTDGKGVPLEFRVTLPVRPSSIQRSIYGSALVPFIGVELCGKPLLEKTEHKPDIVFVKPPFMFGLRDDISVPVIYLQSASDQDPEAMTTEGVPDTGDQNRLQLSDGRFEPVTLCCAQGYTDDLDTVRPIVEDLWPRFDLTEPFERIIQALEELAKQDARFSK